MKIRNAHIIYFCPTEPIWQVPSFGQEIYNTISNILRKNGGLDLLIDQCARQDHDELQFSSAKLLQYCILLSENRGYVVDKGLDKVVKVYIF